MTVKRVGFNEYFIAIIPPPLIYDEANALKQHFKNQYNSKASLNSPPHITLHMPFEWKEEKEKLLIEKLNNFINGLSKLRVTITGFDCFKPRVIFLNVEKTPELATLQKELESFCKRTFQLFHAQYRDLPFHPHLTLAFRDLKKNAFEEAWKEFEKKDFSADFLTERIALLKHNGKIWEVFKEFSLA
jgi:2'-5' RNA ligase